MNRPFASKRPIGPLFFTQSGRGVTSIDFNERVYGIPEQGIAEVLIENDVVEEEPFNIVELEMSRDGDVISTSSYFYLQDTAIIGKIDVVERLRRRGVGTYMINTMLTDMQRRGVSDVYAVVSSVGGRGLSMSTGFTQDAPFLEDDSSVVFRSINEGQT